MFARPADGDVVHLHEGIPATPSKSTFVNRRVLPLLALALTTGLVAGAPASARVRAEPEGLEIARVVAPPGASETVEIAAAEASQRYPWVFPRSAEDRPDERTGRQIHVVYLVPLSMPDDRLDQLGLIEDSVRSMNAWMLEQTTDLRWIFDTYTFEWDDPATPEADPVAVPAVDVSYVEVDLPNDSINSVSEVEDALVAQGFDDPNKRYLSYVASNAGGVCGDAWYPTAPAGGDVDGQYAAVYLYSSPGCRSRDFAPDASTPSFTETIAMQEMIHNDGQVALPAPHDCLISPLAFAHVCTGPLWATDADPERFDVMYPYVGLPLSDKQLDADHLDYFRHPSPYRDLDEGLYLEPA